MVSAQFMILGRGMCLGSMLYTLKDQLLSCVYHLCRDAPALEIEPRKHNSEDIINVTCVKHMVNLI